MTRPRALVHVGNDGDVKLSVNVSPNPDNWVVFSFGDVFAWDCEVEWDLDDTDNWLKIARALDDAAARARRCYEIGRDVDREDDTLARDTRMALRRRINGDGR